MCPVLHEQSSKILVIVGSRRTIDDNGTLKTHRVLEREVRVIPRATILGCSPLVSISLSWSNRTLSHTGNTIVLVVEVLSDTVPMDRSTIVGHLVCHVDTNCRCQKLYLKQNLEDLPSSPQSAVIVGPEMVPLKVKTYCSNPYHGQI